MLPPPPLPPPPTHTYMYSKSTYRSIPSKYMYPWALKHNLQFWPAWVLTWDHNRILRSCRSCYSGPLKYGTLVLAWDTAAIRTVRGTVQSRDLYYALFHNIIHAHTCTHTCRTIHQWVKLFRCFSRMRWQ